jgi:hypothetical protein
MKWVVAMKAGCQIWVACNLEYQFHYDCLIKRGIGRASTKKEALLLLGYVEKHHIIPKCLGGTDRKDNLVYLSAREHYVAHQLLAKIHPESKGLIFACVMMCMNLQGQRSNNRLYSWVRTKQGAQRRGVTKNNSKIIAMMAENTNVLTTSQRQELIALRQSGMEFKQILKHFREQGIDVAYSTLPAVYKRETTLLPQVPDRVLGEVKDEIIYYYDRNNITFKQVASFFNAKYGLDLGHRTYHRYYHKHTKLRDKKLFENQDCLEIIRNHIPDGLKVIHSTLNKHYQISYFSIKTFLVKNNYLI